MRALTGGYPRLGLALVRLAMGVILIYHGYQKLFLGLGGFAGFLDQVGLPMPQVLAPLVSLVEILGGLLLIVGLVTRPLGLFFTLEFLTTLLVVNKIRRLGWEASEIDLLLLASSLMLLIGGPGALALDNRLFRPRAAVVSEPVPMSEPEPAPSPTLSEPGPSAGPEPPS
jgi:putative oxidoreductase